MLVRNATVLGNHVQNNICRSTRLKLGMEKHLIVSSMGWFIVGAAKVPLPAEKWRMAYPFFLGGLENSRGSQADNIHVR